MKNRQGFINEKELKRTIKLMNENKAIDERKHGMIAEYVKAIDESGMIAEYVKALGDQD